MTIKSINVMAIDLDSLQGIAELTDSQIRSINFAPEAKLRKDLLYVVPRQWIHTEKLKQAYNNHEYSSKVVVLGFNADKELVTVDSVPFSSLIQKHYGWCKDDKDLKIRARETEDHVYRAASGTEQHSIWETGGIKYEIKPGTKTGYVKEAIGFRVTGREKAWYASLKQLDSGKWDFEHSTAEGGTYLDLVARGTYRFTQELNLPEIDLTSLPSYKDKFESYFTDLPE